FRTELTSRRRIIRRGMPYGEFAPENAPVNDADERGMFFVGLGASLFRQFEFVQQQWMEHGNDFHQGNDRDPLTGNHAGAERFMIQGDGSPANPPFLCGGLPAFVETRGGEYFFAPSLTALRMIASGAVDAR
ncbi:MAG: Dyp-type peroxidase, partial [Bryobacteraceae bacterium]